MQCKAQCIQLRSAHRLHCEIRGGGKPPEGLNTQQPGTNHLPDGKPLTAILHKCVGGAAPRGVNGRLLGDIVCIFGGGNVPLILRELDGHEYELVGECYVHGFDAWRSC
jgi:hypothetical protein